MAQKEVPASLVNQQSVPSSGSEQKLREVCRHVSNRLQPFDLVAVKFLISDQVPAHSLKRTRNSRDVFQLLDDRRLLNFDLLKELLKVLKRHDLLKHVSTQCDDTRATTLCRNSCRPLLSKTRVLLYNELESRTVDVNELIFRWSLRRSLESEAWVHCVDALLQMYPLDDSADEPAVAGWVWQYIYLESVCSLIHSQHFWEAQSSTSVCVMAQKEVPASFVNQQSVPSNGSEQKLREVCWHVSNRLQLFDLAAVKFLISDQVPAHSLERTRNSRDVFQLLDDRRLLNFELLKELLKVLKRHDLLKHVSTQCDDTRARTLCRNSCRPLLSKTRVLLYNEVESRNVDVNELIFRWSLRRSLESEAWVHCVDALLQMYPLDDSADDPVVAGWVRQYIYLETPDEALPCHAEQAAEEQPQLGTSRVSSVTTTSGVQAEDASDLAGDVIVTSPTIKEQLRSTRRSIVPIDSQLMMSSYSSTRDSVLSKDGQSAWVYKGRCPRHEALSRYEGLDVAIKVFKTRDLRGRPAGQKCSNNLFFKSFSQEILAGHTLKSPFVLPLICYAHLPRDALSRGSYYALMFPLMSSGDLHSCLFDNDDHLSWQDRVRIACQLSMALQTLHTSVPGCRQTIVHGDVKSANVLLDSRGNARLADAEFSQELSGEAGSVRPASSCHCSTDHEALHAADCDWVSFAIVLLEMLTQVSAPAHATAKEEYLKRVLLYEKAFSYKDYTDLKAALPQVGVCCDPLWLQDDQSKQAAASLLYVAVQCLAVTSGKGTRRYAFDRPHREKWLDLAGVSRLRDLTPVTLLRELCIGSSIPFFRRHEHDIPSSASGDTHDGLTAHKCAACFAVMTQAELDSLHTLSPSCQPGSCSWYCTACLSSKEPVFCLEHGRAQPLLGGENVHVLLVSGGGEGTEVFQRDCERLRDTLADVCVAGIREDNMTLMANPEAKSVQQELLSLMLRLEDKVMAATVLRVSTGDCPDIKCPRLLEATREVWAVVRKWNALQKLLSQKNLLPRKTTPQEASHILRELLDITSARTKGFDQGADVALQLTAVNNLWPTEDSERLLSATSMKLASRFTDLIGKARRWEQPELERVAKWIEEKTKDDNKVVSAVDHAKRLADACFATWSLTCGIPTSAEELLRLHRDDVESATASCLMTYVGERAVPTVAAAIAKALRPLPDGLVWFHYSGHAGDGTEELSDDLLPKAHLEAVGRLVANLTVTLDCCHALAKAPKLSFHVSAEAPYSGYVLLAACAATQKSIFLRSSAFTEFLIGALRSATGDCREAFNRAFQGLPCDGNGCEACKAYKARQGGLSCHVCKNLRSLDRSCVPPDAVFEYIKGHLCAKRMKPVIDSIKSESHLPMAYFQHERHRYDVRLWLAQDSHAEDYSIVSLDELPLSIRHLKLHIIVRALQVLKGDKIVDQSAVMQPPCRLVRLAANGTDSMLPDRTVHMHSGSDCRDCIEALGELHSVLDSIMHRARASVDNRSHEEAVHSISIACEQQPPVAASNGMQCSDTDSCTDGHSFEAVSLEGILERLQLSTVVHHRIDTDEAMKAVFTRGFEVYCTIVEKKP